MKTDRELLEMAANAAGVRGEYKENGYRGQRGIWDGANWWNPLTDDGDALRLAVKLKLAASSYSGGTEVWLDDRNGGELRIDQDFGEEGELSEVEAHRMAIVRAAASTWECMQ